MLAMSMELVKLDRPRRRMAERSGSDRSVRAPVAQVFCTTMVGNLAEKSSAFCATEIATLRAIAL